MASRTRLGCGVSKKPVKFAYAESCSNSARTLAHLSVVEAASCCDPAAADAGGDPPPRAQPPPTTAAPASPMRSLRFKFIDVFSRAAASAEMAEETTPNGEQQGALVPDPTICK